MCVVTVANKCMSVYTIFLFVTGKISMNLHIFDSEHTLCTHGLKANEEEVCKHTMCGTGKRNKWNEREKESDDGQTFFFLWLSEFAWYF